LNYFFIVTFFTTKDLKSPDRENFGMVWYLEEILSSK
jgi:hypothetical protein